MMVDETTEVAQRMDTAKVVEIEQVYFRPEEASEYLRVGRTTMFSLLKQSAIPSISIGRVRLVRRADLDAYAESHLKGVE